MNYVGNLIMFGPQNKKQTNYTLHINIYTSNSFWKEINNFIQQGCIQLIDQYF